MGCTSAEGEPQLDMEELIVFLVIELFFSLSFNAFSFLSSSLRIENKSFLVHAIDSD